MYTSEFKKILNTVAIKKVQFDEEGFEFEFIDGLKVTISIEYDTNNWEIESNIEREAARVASEKLRNSQAEKDKRRKELQKEILSKFPKDQWPEIMSVIHY